MFYAVCMSDGAWKGGFDTAEQALAYIAARRCPNCVQAVAERGDEGAASCDAEWDVWTEEDVADCCEGGQLPPGQEIVIVLASPSPPA